jgi:hypothetical protein
MTDDTKEQARAAAQRMQVVSDRANRHVATEIAYDPTLGRLVARVPLGRLPFDAGPSACSVVADTLIRINAESRELLDQLGAESITLSKDGKHLLVVRSFPADGLDFSELARKVLELHGLSRSK